jgi:hypothetical protein
MRRNSSYVSGVMIMLVLVGLVGVGMYVLSTPLFEREKPRVIVPKSISWNLEEPLEIEMVDNVALSTFQMTLSDGTKEVEVKRGAFAKGVKKETTLFSMPKKSGLSSTVKEYTLTVRVKDSSLWNFFNGNSVTQKVTIEIDKHAPLITLLAHSYGITKGGSALVVYKVNEKNLKENLVKTPYHTFKATPYKQEGVFATLVAWPFKQEHFEASIVARDSAGNERSIKVPLFLKQKKYRESYIEAKDRFIEGKITELIHTHDFPLAGDTKADKLRAINESMRVANEEMIYSVASKISFEPLNKWDIKKFYPLKNGQKVASFGDQRHYYYQNKENLISHSDHVGYDLASLKHADIVSSNSGMVTYAEDNGIYGNMVMVDHGLGLTSLYAHCSSMRVTLGDEVAAGSVIAKTGKSGLALGDHLHFGILVQGVEVRPIEWFDAKWIQTNIEKVFKEANGLLKS